MLFNSVEFALFFPIVTLLFWVTPQRAQWLLLLVASCFFYMVFIPVYILILLGTILVDYVAGILIERAAGAQRRALLLSSLVANIGALSVFKYYNFFIANVEATATAIGWHARYLRRLAVRKHLELYGSFSAETAGCGEGEFFDGMHPRASCMEHVITHAPVDPNATSEGAVK